MRLNTISLFSKIIFFVLLTQAAFGQSEKPSSACVYLINPQSKSAATAIPDPETGGNKIVVYRLNPGGVPSKVEFFLKPLENESSMYLSINAIGDIVISEEASRTNSFEPTDSPNSEYKVLVTRRFSPSLSSEGDRQQLELKVKTYRSNSIAPGELESTNQVRLFNHELNIEVTDDDHGDYSIWHDLATIDGKVRAFEIKGYWGPLYVFARRGSEFRKLTFDIEFTDIETWRTLKLISDEKVENGSF